MRWRKTTSSSCSATATGGVGVAGGGGGGGGGAGAGGAGGWGGEVGQLGVGGREQGGAAEPVVEVLGDRPGERDAVEGRGAAADLVEHHQRAAGGVVEDRRRLGHLDHEGREVAAELVAGADPGEDPVDQADPRRR